MKRIHFILFESPMILLIFLVVLVTNTNGHAFSKSDCKDGIEAFQRDGITTQVTVAGEQAIVGFEPYGNYGWASIDYSTKIGFCMCVVEVSGKKTVVILNKENLKRMLAVYEHPSKLVDFLK